MDKNKVAFKGEVVITLEHKEGDTSSKLLETDILLDCENVEKKYLHRQRRTTYKGRFCCLK